jgi:peroxiredoxin
MAVQDRKNSLTVLLLIIIVIMGIEIIYLIYQNRELRAMLDETASFQILEQGQPVPAVMATDLDGAAVEVRYGEGEPTTLLIWLSPSCHVCEENSAFWNDIYSGYQSKDIRFLALCDAPTEEAKTYAAAHSLIFPVVSITDDRLIDAYNGRVMPQTAIISPQGTIERVWPGALEKSRQDEITATLDTLTNEP